MDRKHSLWVERGVALGVLLSKLGRLLQSPADPRPTMDFPADARDAARRSAEIAVAMRNGREIRSETLGIAVRRVSRFFRRRGETVQQDGVVIQLPEAVEPQERRTGTR